MRRAPVILLVLLLAACGGSSKSGAPASSLTAQSIADKIGCSGYTSDSQEMYVQEGGDCTVGGQTVTVYVFKDSTARDSWLKIAQGFGGIYGDGDRWVITGDDSETVKVAVSKAGGKML